MVIGKPHMTERYERWRIRDPREFDQRTFRTHDIGRPGYSKRIAGRLNKTGRWATQALLIAHNEPAYKKKQMRKNVKEIIRKTRRK